MDRPFPHEPASDGDPVPLSFNLNQAAALCGVSVQQLQEWTDCGFIRVNGHGDRRRYDRDALRQILAVRDAIRAGRISPGQAPSRAAAAPASPWRPERARPRQPRNPHSSGARPEARRPEEFSVPNRALSNTELALQAEMFFALNAGTPQTVTQMARRFDVPIDKMGQVLEEMLQARRVMRVRCNGETLYCAGRSQLRGPNPREQRIRATRRPRIPSSPR